MGQIVELRILLEMTGTLRSEMNYILRGRLVADTFVPSEILMHEFGQQKHYGCSELRYYIYNIIWLDCHGIVARNAAIQVQSDDLPMRTGV